jgi:hypothetical protein
VHWSLYSQCGIWDPKGRGVDIWECIRARKLPLSFVSTNSHMSPLDDSTQFTQVRYQSCHRHIFVLISSFSATQWSLLALHRPPVISPSFHEHCHKTNLDAVIPSHYRSWSFGTHRRLIRSKDCVMPPSTSQMKVLHLPGIGDTRVITLPSMRDVEGHS